jgi:hypothetical protein
MLLLLFYFSSFLPAMMLRGIFLAFRQFEGIIGGDIEQT